MSKKHLSYVLICIVAVSTLNVLFSYQIKYIIDALSANNSQAFFSSVLIMLMIVMLLLVIEYSRQIINTKYLNTIGIKIHGTLIHRLVTLDYIEFKKRSNGEYISVINNDIERIKNRHYQAIISLFQGIVSFLIASIALFSLDSVTALFILGVSLFPIAIPYVFEKALSDSQMTLSHAQSEYNRYFTSFLQGIIQYKNAKTANKLVEHIHDNYQAIAKATQRQTKLEALMNVIIGLFFFLSVVGILFVGGLQVLAGTLTIGSLTSIIAISNDLEMPISLISDNLSSIKSVKEIRDKYDTKAEIQPETLVNFNENTGSTKLIEIKDLTYTLNEKVIFDKLNLTFEQGKKYFITGASGRGKSTLAYILTQNIKVAEGCVFFDGQDINHLPYQYVQNQVSYIPQNASLFNASILDNIALFGDYEIQSIKRLIEQFHLNERVKDLNEIIQDEGSVSGGQKNRMVILRALVQDKPFVIIDEGLAGLDHDNFKVVESYLLSLSNTCVIHISHKQTENLSQYDEIVDFDIR